MSNSKMSTQRIGRHFCRSRYVSIFKVFNPNDSKIWTHREFFRNLDKLIAFEVTQKKSYDVIENIYQGPIIASPEEIPYLGGF